MNFPNDFKNAVFRLLALSGFAAAAMSAPSALSAPYPMGAEISRVSFSPKQIRYFTPFDLMAVFHQIFPAGEVGYGVTGCYSLSEVDRPVIGDALPSTGEPAIGEPSFGFVVWVSRCLQGMTKATYDPLVFTPESERFAYGPDFFAWREQAVPGQQIAHLPWRSVPTAIQDGFLAKEILRMVGPDDVIRDFGNFASVADFARDRSLKGRAATAASPPTVAEFAEAFAFAVGLSDEFLSY